MRFSLRFLLQCLAVAAIAGPLVAVADSAPREPGLIGVVFDNPALTKPVRVWTVAEPRAELFSPIARHDYSLSLRGRLTAPTAGEIEIKAEADDGLRLRLDGVTIIDGWALGGAREGRGRIGSDGEAAFDLDYYQDGGPATLRLQWRPAGAVDWTPIPAGAFSYTAADRAAVEARFAALMRDYEKTVAEVANPRPGRWPTLKLIRQGARHLLRASFPNVPDFTCDAYMYESDMDFLDARDAGMGRMAVRHRLREPVGVMLVSMVTPGLDALEIVARPESESGGAVDLPAGLPPPNLCWQLRNAPAFASYPEPYAWFARRCFIFTDRGRTFLDRTERRPSARFPADDPVNNPPWVQVYLPAGGGPAAGRPFPWAGISPDRFTATIVGVVSRDGRYLAALANDSATSISQVWIDCLHNNPEWERGAAPDSRWSWRVRIYAMANDPATLLRRVAEDFPAVRAQPAFGRQ